MIEPLHIATVGGHRLRFFRTPLNDGRPDFPWHCVDDLQRCLGLNRQGRKVFLHMLRSNKEWGAIVRTVAATDGVVTVAPNFMAQGTVDAMIEEGMTPASIRREFDHASVEAMHKMPKPPFPSDEFLDWMKTAMNRWEEAR
jgi:hypothetical protein